MSPELNTKLQDDLEAKQEAIIVELPDACLRLGFNSLTPGAMTIHKNVADNEGVTSIVLSHALYELYKKRDELNEGQVLGLFLQYRHVLSVMLAAGGQLACMSGAKVNKPTFAWERECDESQALDHFRSNVGLATGALTIRLRNTPMAREQLEKYREVISGLGGTISYIDERVA